MVLNSANKIANEFEGTDEKDDWEDRAKIEAGSLENGQVTQFYYKKLIELEISLSIITIVNLYLIVLAADQTFKQNEGSQITLTIYLYCSLVCAVLAMIILGMRAQTVLQLEKQQILIYKQASLFSTKKIVYLIVEFLVLLAQPYPFLSNTTYTSSNAFADYQIYYPVNDLMSILSFARIYILFRSALLLTPYMNNRSNRLCKMYGCKADFSFSLKCMFKDNPLTLICIFFATSALVFAYVVYLAERQLAVQNNNSFQEGVCNNYLNALWLILMTVTTVGYGDYYPQTPLGRIIILFVAIWGTLIVSIMVVVVSNTLNMEKNEVRTSKIINKLQLREELKKKSGKFIGYFVFLSLKKGLNSNTSKELSKKFRRAQLDFKDIGKKIKQISEYDDIEDEIAAHFLKLNSDIDILNRNQDKIIQFIHENFNYVPTVSPAAPQPIYSKDQKDQDEQDEAFMQQFRQKYKVQ